MDGLNLLLESLQVLNEVRVLPLKGRDGSGVPAQLVGHGVLFLQDSTQNVFAVVEVLVELSGGLEHLRSESHKTDTKDFTSGTIYLQGDGVNEIA